MQQKFYTILLNQHICNDSFEDNNYFDQNIPILEEIKEFKSSETETENFENITTPKVEMPKSSKVLSTSVHDGKKSFICNDCNICFKKRGTLNEHIATNHEGKKLKSLPLTESRLELVKDQCGRHTLSELASYFQ